MAKNAIRRALIGVVNPHPNPSQIGSLWEFFESSCAYCAKPLVRGTRDAHVDHIVPVQDGGINHISNCVLSCPVCNGDEKREEHRESFLRRKAPDDFEFAARKDRIERWVAACAPAAPRDAILLETVSREIEAVISTFDRELENIRRAKRCPPA